MLKRIIYCAYNLIKTATFVPATNGRMNNPTANEIETIQAVKAVAGMMGRAAGGCRCGYLISEQVFLMNLLVNYHEESMLVRCQTNTYTIFGITL